MSSPAAAEQDVMTQRSKVRNLPQYISFRMTLTGDPTRRRFTKIMSNYWTVFGVVSALVICLVLEVSIVNVSGFSNPHNSATDIPLFSSSL